MSEFARHYVRRPGIPAEVQKVAALQWTGSNVEPMLAFLGGHFRYDENGPAVLTAPDGNWEPIFLRDWAVISTGAVITVVQDVPFTAMFQAVGNG